MGGKTEVFVMVLRFDLENKMILKIWQYFHKNLLSWKPIMGMIAISNSKNYDQNLLIYFDPINVYTLFP